MTSEDSNNVSNSKGYNPYKRISDRVEMIQNQVVIQRSSYDRLNKDYLGKTELLALLYGFRHSILRQHELGIQRDGFRYSDRGF